MAIGLALLLGFRFPDNFNRPYAATSLQDFWRRWHMTLSRWLRDYLYIPLGGSRFGRRRTYRALMLTMLLGGLWHGAAWTFVVWGAIHGAGLVAQRWWADRWRPEPDGAPMAAGGSPSPGTFPVAVGGGGGVGTLEAAPRVTGTPWRTPAPLRVLVTFHLVCLAWIFFRSPDLGTAWQMIGRLITWAPGPAPLVTPTVLIAIVVGLATQFVPTGFWPAVQARFQRLTYGRQAVAFGAFLVLIYAAGGNSGVAPFIYFRF
jgi:alginate O-acetyltransferase complex protein AlgI